MRREFLIAGALVICLAMLGAGPVAAQTPKRGGTVNFVAYGDPARLDLHKESVLAVAIATGGVFSGLLQWDPARTDKIVPDLATGYEVSNNGKTYTFKLRRNVRWHDGKPFTARDVQASMDRLLDPDFKGRRCGTMMKETVESVSTVDDYTMRFQMKFPNLIFLSQIASMWCRIYPAHILKRDGNFTDAKSQIGTGPFKFKRYKRNQIIEWVRNDDYYDKRYPYVDGVKIHILKGATRQLAAAKAGLTDTMIYPRFNKSLNMELKKERGDKVLVYKKAVNGFWSVIFKSQREPFNKKDIRRAVYLGIDKQKMIEKGLEGLGVPCAILEPNIHGDYALSLEEVNKMPGCRQPKDQDLAEARRLVKKHYPDGVDIEMVTRQVSNYADRIQLMAAELRKIGFRVKIRTYRSAVGLKTYGQGNFAIIGTQDHGFALPDPHDVFSLLYSKGGGRNWGHWFDQGTQDLIDQAKMENDRAKRVKLYHKLQRRLFNGDMPVISIGYNEGFYWQHARLKNYYHGLTVYDALTFMKVWLDE